MKRTILFLFSVVMTTAVMAQQDNNTLQNVSVMEFDYQVKEGPRSDVGVVVGAVLDVLADQTTTEQPGYAEAARSSIIAAMGNVRRFRITDGRQVAPGEATNIIADGNVNFISVTRELRLREKDKDRVPMFYAQISVTVNLKDAATGTLINGQTFEVNRSGWSWVNSTDTAMKNALEKLRKMVEKYYNTAFPYTARIIERGAEKRDKQKQVYIDLGSAHGLQKGTHFDVYVIGSIGGKETRKEIARLKVKEVEGDEVSLCKVTSGGRDLKAAMDAQQKLLIISTD